MALVALAALAVFGRLAGCGGEPTPMPAPTGCLPRCEKPQWILRLHDSGGPSEYIPWPVTGDFNGDGLDDLAILPGHGAADPPSTAEIRFLLNDGSGGLYLCTRTLFSGPIPRTQNPAALMVVA